MAIAAHPIDAVDAEPRHDQHQYLTFMLGRETFALGILGIKEILEYTQPTDVPMMPPSIRGVVNLRGAVVPVIDLCARFGRPSTPVSKKTCIVIVETRMDAEHHVLGVLVDAVNEVLEIPDEDIEPPPTFGASIRTDFIQGMGKVRGRFVIILDEKRVLSVEEMEVLVQTGTDAMQACA
ncbi:chemotaxis protein CheW [Steroidobacter denitrificans]|uniref:Chemotaxis protein CheW n=1 Tax=Steroidobacter denitrificans TaxID=465721 RepID=A0A127FC50_STEDE|nr:chemotaxis protein CheW [Steroidobacter denitrificans]